MIIDIFPHIVTPKYKKVLLSKLPNTYQETTWYKYLNVLTSLSDLDSRLRIMDKHEGYVQVLNISLPAVETLLDVADTIELTRMANDEMAELVTKYPDRFVAAVASLPLNDIDATLRELDRAINELHFKGIQLYTDINGKPLDSPEFMPIYEKMVKYDLPILLHPSGQRRGPDYPTEKESKYYISSLYGREYDTSVALTRLVFSGIMEKYPNLKIIAHHFAGMIAFVEKRIDGMYELHEKVLGRKYADNLSKRPVDYFRMFYCDTAYGSVPGLMCVCSFFGTSHVLYGTDMPFDSEMGNKKIRETTKTIEQLNIPASDKRKIFEENARRLLHLPG